MEKLIFQSHRTFIFQMYKLLAVNLLLLILRCQVLLKSSGESATGPDWITTNCPVSPTSNTDTVVPYQFTQILNQTSGLFRMRFNFTAGAFPQGAVSTAIRQTTAEDFRVDGYEDLKVELAVNLTTGAQTVAYDSYLQVNYRYRQSKFVRFSVFYWKGPTAACASPKVNISGIEYGLVNVAADKYALNPCQPSPAYLNTTIDLTELGRYVLSLGDSVLRVWDARREVKVFVRVQGAGEVTFVQRAYHVQRVQNIFQQQKIQNNYAVVNQPFYGAWTQKDFINISLPVNGSTSGIISEMYFVTPSSSLVNGENWILIGAFFGVWRTPIGFCGIPASVGTDTSIFTNFSFTPEIAPISTNSSVGFLLNLRDDYNPITKSFLKSDTNYLSSQLLIYLWTSEKFDIFKQISSFNYYGINWRVKQLDTGNTPKFFVYARENVTETKNFDVFTFIRYFRDVLKAIKKTEYLVTVQAGFRYKWGKAKFFITDLSFQQKKQPYTSTYVWQNPQDKTQNGLSSCHLISNDTETCENVELVSKGVENFLSLQALAILMRLSPVISLIDELTFYAYHQANYDRGFKFIVQLCSEWTDNKWVPPFLEGASEWARSLSAKVNETAIDGQTVRLPNKFYQFGKSNNFYSNIADFLVISLPLNLCLFLLLRGLHALLARLGVLPFLQALVRPFSSLACFWGATFADNLTFLGFHCFLQFYAFVPYSDGAHSFPSCVLCLMTLFAVLLTVCVLGFAAWRFARSVFEISYFSADDCRSYLFFGLSLAVKCLSAFFHAYVDSAQDRAFGLFALQTFLLLTLVCCCGAIQFKTYRVMYLLICVCKVVLHFQLFLEIWQPQIIWKTENSATENSFILGVSIITLLLALNLCNNLSDCFSALRNLNKSDFFLPPKITRQISKENIHSHIMTESSQKQKSIEIKNHQTLIGAVAFINREDFLFKQSINNLGIRKEQNHREKIRPTKIKSTEVKSNALLRIRNQD